MSARVATCSTELKKQVLPRLVKPTTFEPTVPGCVGVCSIGFATAVAATRSAVLSCLEGTLAERASPALPRFGIDALAFFFPFTISLHHLLALAARK